MFRCLIMLMVALNLTPALARTLTVEGVVSPAWVERAGKREPLTVGLQLTDQDKIITGERARVMLRMSEGSAVKLGENATLALDNLAQKTQAGKAPAVSASLDVVKGAFRFTTGVFGKPAAGRRLSRGNGCSGNRAGRRAVRGACAGHRHREGWRRLAVAPANPARKPVAPALITRITGARSDHV